jgi:O-antigen ligase
LKPSVSSGPRSRAASHLDAVQSFGLAVLLVSLPLSEFMKSAGLLLAVLGFVGKLMLGRRPRAPSGPTLWALLAFYVAAVASVVFAAADLRRPNELFTLGMTICVFPILADSLSRASRRTLFAWAVVAGAALAAVLGYLDYMRGDYDRLALPSIENPVPAAEYLAAAAVLSVALLLSEARAPFAGPTLGFCSGVLVMALLMAKSRGPLAGVVAGIAVMIGAYAGRKRHVLVALVVPAAVIVWFAAANPDARVAEDSLIASRGVSVRVETWERTVELVEARPVVGHGLGSFSRLGVTYRDDVSMIHQRNAHNVWLHAACETGLVGVSALTLFLVLCVRELVRTARRSRGTLERALTSGVLGAVVAILVAGLTSVSTDAEPGMLLFALVALGAGVPGDSRTEIADTESRT